MSSGNYIGDVKIAGAAGADCGMEYIKVATGTVTVKCLGFVSDDDTTVIDELNVGETNYISTRHNAGSQTLKTGIPFLFGYTADSIKLSAGSGWIIRAESF